MDERLPLSISLITRNEAENLARCLQSVQALASEIIVIDCGSTDATEQIAREHGAVFEHASWPGFAPQKNRALERCTQPWILCLDADEALSPELQQSIRKLFRDGEPACSGYAVNRRTFFLGDWIWHAWYPEWLVRLVRRGEGQWAGLEPHITLGVTGVTDRLQGDLLHYSFRDLADHLHRTLNYSQTMAASYARQGRPFRWVQLLVSPWLAFLKHLVLRQGFRDGWRGWLIAFSKWLDVFAKYAFLLEHEKRAGTGTGARASKTNLPPNR